MLGVFGFAGLAELVVFVTVELSMFIAWAWGPEAAILIPLGLGFIPMGIVFLVATAVSKWLLVGCIRPGMHRHVGA